MERENHPLMGKTITSIDIAKDKMALRFNTIDGPIFARTDGDCCSHTWIENVELPALGFPCTVNGVEALYMPQDMTKDDRYEYIQVYGVGISTTAGEIVIDFRNSSNGYYGGNIDFGTLAIPDPADDPEKYYYGGVYNQNRSRLEWKELQC